MTRDLVSVRTADGVTLNGSLQRPEGGSTLPFDCGVLHHGASANFYGPSPLFETLEAHLVASGCAVLRVNSRGHDVVFNSARGSLGSAYEIVDDGRLDLRAWTDFAEAAGFRRIAHWGHSLGALKSVYFMAKEKDARVPLIVAASPPRFSYRTFIDVDRSGAFAAEYEKARRLVEAGQPDELFAISEPIRSLMAARTFVDKYGPEERYDVLDLLPAVQVPVFVSVGNESSEGPGRPFWYPFNRLVENLSALASHTRDLTFVHLPEADHSYAGQAEALWSAAEAWLRQLSPAAMSGR